MTNSAPWIEVAPGIMRQTITTGSTMYQMRARLKKGSRLPEHQHPQEQIVHVVSGRIVVIAAGTRHELAAGESFYLAANVPHAVETIEETQAIDTFSPPREDYLAADRAAH
ncbi:MAG: cupin domain-containing protein [Chthoniobacterales bacterium]|nr:cupin domain-containing protein [Chthoniobacterales bacterium]